MHNLRWTTNGFGLVLCLANAAALADSNGRGGVSGMTAGVTCESASCHVAGAAVPTVTISGPTSVTAGVPNRYTVTITGGPAVQAGIDVAAASGTFGVADAGTKIDTGITPAELTHSAPKNFVAGTATYLFDWTATAATAPVTLYVAGFSGDGSGRRGDGTGLATLAVTVGGAATNQPPRALISGPSSTAAGVTVTFTGTGSTDPDGTIATYDWNFGDGTAGSGATVTKSFAAGTWPVQLTVTDNLGLTSTAMTPIVVAAAGSNVAPTANAGGPYSGTVGSAIAFNGAASTDSDGTISAYAWNFGDGSTPGTGVTTSYTYTAAGNYTATLTVTDNAGATATSQAAVSITSATTGTPAATEGEAFFNDECAGCHGPGGAGGDIFGESAADIAEAFIEVPDHAGLVDLPQAHIDAIAAFLNGATTDVTEGEAFFNAECEACHGAGGAGGSIAGESAEDIAEAFVEIPDHAALVDLPQAHIDAIAAFLAAATDEDDDDDDAAAPPAAPLSPQGNGSGNATDAATSNASARGTGGGVVDAWLAAGLLLWGGRRVLRYVGGLRGRA